LDLNKADVVHVCEGGLNQLAIEAIDNATMARDKVIKVLRHKSANAEARNKRQQMVSLLAWSGAAGRYGLQWGGQIGDCDSDADQPFKSERGGHHCWCLELGTAGRIPPAYLDLEGPLEPGSKKAAKRGNQGGKHGHHEHM